MNLSSTTTIAPLQRLVATLLLSALASCGGGGTDDSTQALTESDFAANPSLRLNSGAVGVTFMEAKGGTASAGAVPDTGDAGMDVMPLHIAQQTSTTYSLDPKDDTLEKVQLVRLPGKQFVFEITASNPSAKVTLDPGDYDLMLYSGHKDAQPRTVFLQNNLGNGALQSDGSSNLGYTLTDIYQLFSTKSCRFCDLKFANLSRVNLRDAYLYGADLHGADLSGASLTSANLSYANMSLAVLSYAKLNNANLSGAGLSYANLSGASLSDANLKDAILYGANLTGAILDRANLTGADFTGAIGYPR